MSSPLDQHDLQELLSAFPDGELDPAQNLAVLTYLKSHPEAMFHLRTQQLLRESAQRIARADQRISLVPDALKQRLHELARTAAIEPTPRSTSSKPPADRASRFGTGRLLALAAALVVGLLVGVFWNRFRAAQTTSPGKVLVVATRPALTAEEADRRDADIPDAVVDSVMHVHLDCSRVAEALHSGGYPAQLGSLSGLVKADLHSTAAEPDLSSLGYHYVGAGPCAHPLEGTVHLLYKQNGPEPRASLSVFAQRYHGQFSLQPGRLYRIGGEPGSFPMFAWQTKDVLYFLVADDSSTAAAALRTIASAPRPRGT